MKYVKYLICTFIIFVSVILLFSIFMNYTSNTIEAKIYRDGFNLPLKECEFKLPSNNNSWKYDSSLETCPIQNTFLPEAEGINNENSYKLAFLELDENGKLFNERQMNKITQLLSSNKEKLVTVYVHGWRHDAAPKNKDINRFRTLLAYSRMFLNQRNERPKELIGIYVGWRGRSVQESENPLFALAAALPSYWGRKTVSDNLGKALIGHLSIINDTLKSNAPSLNKMLIVGHSMGGNMLITGLKKSIDSRIEEYRKNSIGSNFQPLIGDLVVLINPAAEASKWNSIQENLRKKTKNSKPEAKKNPHSKDFPFGSYFPNTQKPVLLSLTATSNWSSQEIRIADKNSWCHKVTQVFNKEWIQNLPYLCVKHDYATKEIFTLANTLIWQNGAENRIAIGHYHPETFNFFTMSTLKHYGTTHELVLNSSAGVATQLKNLSTSECVKIDGALLTTRKNSSDTWAMWDSGSSHNNALVPFTSTGKNNQIRRGLSLSGKNKSRLSKITPSNTPFWNMRVINSVEDHGGYVSYPTWCFINQFVLDDITAEK